MIKGICLSPADLAISKLVAGRDKDIRFVSILLKNSWIDIEEIEKLLSELPKEKRNVVKRNLGLSRSSS
ncbi:MAG: hypothetical protein GY866_19150 [Proteobacteria bacterium]|nr:hypothetical protein [Pseudomonadota bacterium]